MNDVTITPTDNGPYLVKGSGLHESFLAPWW
jgi:hypothetical protein